MPGWLLLTILAIVGGIVVATLVTFTIRRIRRGAEAEAGRILEQARADVERLRRESDVAAKNEVLRQREAWEKEQSATRQDLRDAERRLAKREEALEARQEGLQKRERFLDDREKRISQKLAQIEAKEAALDGKLREQQERLLQIASFTREQAMAHLEEVFQKDLLAERERLLARHQADLRDEMNRAAQEVVTTAIARTCVAHTTEASVSTVDLPSDDLKGRIIGREGRNIRTFEKVTGCDLVVDDTPGVVVVSSFDPVRREIARITLEQLLVDGRIHPARIEETFAAVQKEVEEDVRKTGRAAVQEMEIGSVHPRIVECVGRLKYRYSYGQNVLLHSKEVGWLCAAMAAELKLDPTLARRCGFLHDIGKAVDQEIEGSHPGIGLEIARRCNEHPFVVNAIGGHHAEIPFESPYTPLTQAADAISASRPGARLDSLERYIKRLRTLEEAVQSFAGVASAYAIQAGREVRVLVNPAEVTDEQSLLLAREIAKKIESELTYPGEIKVTLIREKRVVEYAR